MKNNDYKIQHGDALECLREFEENSIDGIITDPPYSSGGLHSSQRKQSTSVKYLARESSFVAANFLGDNRDQRSWFAWCSLWLSQCYRIAKDGAPVCLFTDWRQLPTISDAMQAAGFIWQGVVVWDKTRGCRPRKGGFSQQAEFVVWGTKGKLASNNNAVYLDGLHTCNINKGGDRCHQTGKPIPLMQEIVRIVPEGGLILDPFMGSGSTGVACLKDGYRFHGIELTDYYYEVSKQRLAQCDGH